MGDTNGVGQLADVYIRKEFGGFRCYDGPGVNASPGVIKLRSERKAGKWRRKVGWTFHVEAAVDILLKFQQHVVRRVQQIDPKTTKYMKDGGQAIHIYAVQPDKPVFVRIRTDTPKVTETHTYEIKVRPAGTTDPWVDSDPQLQIDD